MSTSKIFDKLNNLFPNKLSITSGNFSTVLKSVEFKTTGVSTWKVPVCLNNIVWITLFGGGGAGGMVYAGGGGSGTKIVKYPARVIKGETISITVGTGATGRNTAGNGANGNPSSVSGLYVSITAEGGGGGKGGGSLSAAGGTSGLGVAGASTSHGTRLDIGFNNYSLPYFKTAASGGSGSAGGSAVYWDGGPDFYGSGGSGQPGHGGGGGGGYLGGLGSDYGPAGAAEANSGSGGGGSQSAYQSRYSGAGGSGYCKIEWYELA
jgi:hypothetical protein